MLADWDEGNPTGDVSGSVVVAAFDSECQSCGDSITEGQDIRYSSDDDGWVHANEEECD